MAPRVVIYARISDDREGLALGVERQVEDCRERAKREGWEVAPEDVIVENDVGASAHTKKDRPLFERMMQSVERGEVDVILAYSNSRLTRRPRELERLITASERTGVYFRTVVSGDDDLATADGRMVARIKASVDAAEAERISERSRRAFQQEAARGRPHMGGNRRPYGFKDDRITHEPAEAAVIRELAERVISGESLRSLRDDLNRRGLKPVAADKWSLKMVTTVLKQPRTAGLRTYKGDIVGSATWEPIIPRDQWEAVLAAIASRPKYANNRIRSMLSGLLRCGASYRDGAPCGAMLFSQGKKYVCLPDNGCARISRNRARVDAYVLARVIEHVGELEERQGDKPQEPEVDPRVAQLTDEIQQAERKTREIADAYAKNQIRTQDYFATLTTLRDRITDLTKERGHLVTALRRDTLPTATESAALAVDLMSPETTDDYRRAALAKYIDMIVIRPSERRGPVFDPDSINIVWKR